MRSRRTQYFGDDAHRRGAQSFVRALQHARRSASNSDGAIPAAQPLRGLHLLTLVFLFFSSSTLSIMGYRINQSVSKFLSAHLDSA